ncbi:MAG TPA: peptide deformylase [Candidatus Saccharimonadales bacterium]|nr:peptide deformylase [Candidatus Saccharimonadales bacterium]
MPKFRDKLITLPNPGLGTPSQKVGVVNQAIKDLVTEMEDTVLDWEASREHEVGVALAAIQINRPLKVVVIRNNFDDKEDKTFTVLINPIITKYEGKIEDDYEGCLSVQDVYGKVPRHSKIRLKAKDLRGKEFRLNAEGFLARVLQHEVDHTKGIMFVDHIIDDHEAFYKLTDKGNLEPLSEKDPMSHRIFR